ncbi:MAG TPA: hypothetical protein VKR06_17810 [Ktedonosporobacter sp.]|nr:hypothetical protein [Ktedonosporobacter sp.]
MSSILDYVTFLSSIVTLFGAAFGTVIYVVRKDRNFKYIAIACAILAILLILYPLIHWITWPAGSGRSTGGSGGSSGHPVSILVLSGTEPENWPLMCTCDDTILTTISSVTINTSLQSMFWDITLYNKSADQQAFEFPPAEFVLLDPSGPSYEASGNILIENSQTGVWGWPQHWFSSHGTEKGQITFTFDPVVETAYTLNVHFHYVCPVGWHCPGDFDFDQVTFSCSTSNVSSCQFS